MNGIDVSHHQGQIDWVSVRHAQISFAFIKATEGLALTDCMFQKNWEAARKNAIRRGAYHFFRPELDPDAQARHFLAVFRNDPGELPPALDVEVLGDMSPDELVARAMRWMNLVGFELDCRPILYTGSSFWRTSLKNSPAFNDHPLWIAHYTDAANPRLPSAWRDWNFWQYSQSGRLPGINGSVDLNVFNGTMEDLEKISLRKVFAAAK